MDGPVGPLTFHVAVEGAAAALKVRHFSARPTAKVELGLIHVLSKNRKKKEELSINYNRLKA